MSDRTKTQEADPRVRRHNANKARIIKEAWKLASRDGVAGVSLGDLAKAVDLRQPSLYTYFRSKSDLYDEMFADGYEKMLAKVVRRDYPEDPRAALKVFVKSCVEFASEDVARHHLLFQRHVPRFSPSPKSFALAQEFYEFFKTLVGRLGIKRQQDLDIFAAVTQGLADQQVANEPGGRRWVQLSGIAVDMYLDQILGTRRRNR